MKATLIKSNQTNFLPNNITFDNINVKFMFKTLNKMQIIIRPIFLLLNINIPICFYNMSLKNLDADLIIVTDCHLQTRFVKWLREHNPKTRIIVWYWNTIEEVGKNIYPGDLPNDVEKWSYSKYDCIKYNLQYNTTFYPYENKVNKEDVNISNDVYFIGKDKGRLKKIIKFRDMLNSLGVTTEFHICPTKKYLKYVNSIYESQIPYQEVIKGINRSKAILDLCVSQNAGITIRPMEAIFYNKKLITDNINIIEEPFYDKNNIFIYGKDDINTLCNFINSPYKKISKDIIDNYTMKKWFERFMDGSKENK